MFKAGDAVSRKDSKLRRALSQFFHFFLRLLKIFVDDVEVVDVVDFAVVVVAGDAGALEGRRNLELRLLDDFVVGVFYQSVEKLDDLKNV